MNEEYELTNEEMIEDTLAKAFVMLLGINMPEERVMEHLCSWVNIQYSKTNEPLTEDFILMQISKYINYLFKR